MGPVLSPRVPVPRFVFPLEFFLLLTALWRHVRPPGPRHFSHRWFAAIGAGSSFLSALVGSVGPLMAPFFLAYGLTRGAYVGTEALATAVMHAIKLVGYRGAAVLGMGEIVRGLALAPTMVVGSYLGKLIVVRVPERAFVVVVEGVMLFAGVSFLTAG